jgi:alanine racemase
VAQARAWQAFDRPAILQVDTGMARHGLTLDEARGISLPLRAIMSHLSCSDEPEHPENAEQLARFEAVAALFPGVARCFANSGGFLLGGAYRGDIIRPGVALYGGQADDGTAPAFAPVVTLEARVIQTRAIEQGTGVGYGQTWHAPRPTRLATVAIGYADGFPRSLSNCGAAWALGSLLPIVGRVSMDVIVVDITALPDGALGEGDMVEIIGPHRPLHTVAVEAGTIDYEILTQLGRRYERRIIPA